MKDAPSPRSGAADPSDVAQAYRFFLGREPESRGVTHDKAGLALPQMAKQFLASDEYAQRVAEPLLAGRLPSGGVFGAPPSPDLVRWAAVALPLSTAGRRALAGAGDWAGAHAAVLGDEDFQRAYAELAGQRPWRTLAACARTLADRLGGRRVAGALEEVTRLAVSGYVLDLDAPDAVRVVELWADGRKVAVARAGDFRRDLEARYGGSGRHGFVFTGFVEALPPGEAALQLEVRDALSGVALGGAQLDRGPAHRRELARLADELSVARATLARIEEAVNALSASEGFSVSDWAAYRRAFYTPTPQAAHRHAEAAADPRLPRPSVLLVGSPMEPRAADASRASLDAQALQPAAVRTASPAQAPDDLAGGWWVLIDAGDRLAPDALLRFAEATLDGGCTLITSDFQAPDAQGGEAQPHLLPAFDPDLLLQTPYLPPAFAVRGEALQRALADGGGLGRDGRADLLFRLVEIAGDDAVRHVPRVLVEATAALDPGDHLAAARTHLSRIGSGATAGLAADPIGDPRPRIRITWPTGGARVAVIVPTRDRLDLLEPCVGSLEATREANRTRFEIVVADNDSAEPATRARLEAWARTGRVRVLPCPGPFNFSAINNAAARAVESDVLVFLNNDTLAATPDWCDEFAGQAMRPEVGAVGARLLFGDGSVQHAGVVLGTRGAVAAHEGAGARAEDDGYLGRRGLVHRAAAVTGACLAVRRELFLRLGGFDADALPIEANDIDWCLRVRRAGLAVLYDPRVTFHHLESRSRGHTGLDDERRRQADVQLAAFRRRWEEDALRDPAYNPHFDRAAAPFARLGPPPEGRS